MAESAPDAYASFFGTWVEKDRGNFVEVMAAFANLGFMKKNAMKLMTLKWVIEPSETGKNVKITAPSGEVSDVKEGEAFTSKEGATVLLNSCFVMDLTKDGKTQTITRTIEGNVMKQVHVFGDLKCEMTLTKQA